MLRTVLRCIFQTVPIVIAVTLTTSCSSRRDFVGKWQREGADDWIEIAHDLVVRGHLVFPIGDQPIEQDKSINLRLVPARYQAIGPPVHITITRDAKEYSVSLEQVSTTMLGEPVGSTFRVIADQTLNVKGSPKGRAVLEVKAIAKSDGESLEVTLFTLRVSGHSLQLVKGISDVPEGRFRKIK
jgi:hypothetical protein